MAAAVGDIPPTPPTRSSHALLQGSLSYWPQGSGMGVFPASFLAESRPGAGFWLLFFLWFQRCVV